jgi:hypothetical protein
MFFETWSWLPPIASTVLFFACWRGELISRPGIVGSWWAVGIALQLVGARFSPVWLAGVLINVGLAVYLSLVLKAR